MNQGSEEKIHLGINLNDPMTPDLYRFAKKTYMLESGDSLYLISNISQFNKSFDLIPFTIDNIFDFFDDPDLVLYLLGEVLKNIRSNFPIIKNNPEQISEVMSLAFDLLNSDEFNEKLEEIERKEEANMIIQEIQAVVVCHIPDKIEILDNLTKNLPQFFSFLRILSRFFKMGFVGAFSANIEEIKKGLYENGAQIELLEIACNNIDKAPNATEALCDLFGWIHIDLFSQDSTHDLLETLRNTNPMYLLTAFTIILDRKDVEVEKQLQIIDDFDVFQAMHDITACDDPKIDEVQKIAELILKIEKKVPFPPVADCFVQVAADLVGVVREYNPFPAQLATATEHIMFAISRRFEDVKELAEYVASQIDDLYKTENLPGDPDKRLEALIKILLPLSIDILIELVDVVIKSDFFRSSSDRAFLFIAALKETALAQLPDAFVIELFRELCGCGLYNAPTDSEETLGLMGAAAGLVCFENSRFLKGELLEAIAENISPAFENMMLSTPLVADLKETSSIFDRDEILEKAVDACYFIFTEVPEFGADLENICKYIVPITGMGEHGKLLNAAIINSIGELEMRADAIENTIEVLSDLLDKQDAIRLLLLYDYEGLPEEVVEHVKEICGMIYDAYMEDRDIIDIDLYKTCCEACVTQDPVFIKQMVSDVIAEDVPLVHAIVAADIVAANKEIGIEQEDFNSVMGLFVGELEEIRRIVTTRPLGDPGHIMSEHERERLVLLGCAVRTIVSIWDDIEDANTQQLMLRIVAAALFGELSSADLLNVCVTFVLKVGVSNILEKSQWFFAPADALTDVLEKAGHYDNEEAAKVVFVFRQLAKAAGGEAAATITENLPPLRRTRFLECLGQPGDDFAAFTRGIFPWLMEDVRTDEEQADDEGDGEEDF